MTKKNNLDLKILPSIAKEDKIKNRKELVSYFKETPIPNDEISEVDNADISIVLGTDYEIY